MKALALSLLWLFARPYDYRAMAGDLIEDSRDSREMLWQVLRSLGALLEAMIARGDMARALLGAAATTILPLATGELFWTFVYSQVPLKEALVRGPAVWISIGVLILFQQSVAVLAAGSRLGLWMAMLGLLLAVPVSVSFPVQPPVWFWFGLTAFWLARLVWGLENGVEVRR